MAEEDNDPSDESMSQNASADSSEARIPERTDAAPSNARLSPMLASVPAGSRGATSLDSVDLKLPESAVLSTSSSSDASSVPTPQAATGRRQQQNKQESQQRRTSIPDGRTNARYNRRSSAHHADETFSSLNASHHEYRWRMFAPKKGGFCDWVTWLITGHSHETSPLSDTREKIKNLARTLCLLREYEGKFGLPNGGSKREQEFVLEELCKDLYSSGVPIWVLQPVMGIAATGLTGLENFDFFLLPASGIIDPPSDHGYYTQFFQTDGGFCMYRINMYEKVLARLASFSTNTRTINSVPDESLPKLLMEDVRQYHGQGAESIRDKEDVAKEILDLASRGYGLFFLTRVEELLTQEQAERQAIEEGDDESAVGGFMSDGEGSILSYNSFWSVDESIRELFTRLATIEAAECLDSIHRSPSLEEVWPRRYIVLFRMMSSAGSSALWFNGSWADMLLSASIAGAVALIFQTNRTMWKNQRLVFEVVVSFVVGVTAGLINIRIPDETCFVGIAIASMIDYLRGFGIVFSIMEVMSKNTMAGSSDLIEAILFSFLIAMSIIFGLGLAERIMGIENSDSHEYLDCGQPVPELWYVLIIPVASIGWAAGFKPAYRDMPLMALHGALAFMVSFALERAFNDDYTGSFVAALITSIVAGLVSRFTGRQALGDTFTGLFALVPGIYITEGFFSFAFGDDVNEGQMFLTLVLKAVVIGVGAWCGTLLCAPTNLGTNHGIISEASKKVGATANDELGAMLYI